MKAEVLPRCSRVIMIKADKKTCMEMPGWNPLLCVMKTHSWCTFKTKNETLRLRIYDAYFILVWQKKCMTEKLSCLREHWRMQVLFQVA